MHDALPDPLGEDRGAKYACPVVVELDDVPVFDAARTGILRMDTGMPVCVSSLHQNV